MASPPTPGSFVLGELISWGPLLAGERTSSGRLVELVDERLALGEDKTASKLLELSQTHRYVLLERIASSRHAVVCVAVDRVLTRHVAVKLHRQAGKQVVAEARAMSTLEHPNVVQIYDFGQVEGSFYAVTELCDCDLLAWCEGRSWREILARVIEAGRGLERLHAERLVHRDVKPSNILIKAGVAKIADFGLASKPGSSPEIAGTPGFIAPEVADGLRSAAGDLFALATTAWVCLFGELPFGELPADRGLEEAIRTGAQRASDRAFVTPNRRPLRVPKSVEEALREALRADPRERPPLERWLRELSALLEPTPRLARVRRWLPTLAVAGGCLVGAAGLLGKVWLDAGPEPASEQAPPRVAADYLEEAERAARRGDVDQAVSQLYQAYGEIEGLSDQELVELAEAAARLAKVLEQRGRREDALIAWSFVVRLYENAGRVERAEDARRSFEAVVTKSGLGSGGGGLKSTDPDQNR